MRDHLEASNSKDICISPCIQHQITLEIIQRLTIQGKSISHIDTKYVQDLPEGHIEKSIVNNQRYYNATYDKHYR